MRLKGNLGLNRTPVLVAGTVAVVTTAFLFGMEALYTDGFPRGIPWAVFGFLAATSFLAVIATSAGFTKFTSHKFSGLSLIMLGLMALFAWATLFVDQLPCFLGGMGC
jgi:hypothetical protein